MQTPGSPGKGISTLLVTAALCVLLDGCGGGDSGTVSLGSSAATTVALVATPDATTQVARQPKLLYSVTDLGLDGSAALDINDRGAVLFRRGGVPSIYRDGAVQTLPTGCIQYGNAINDKGDVAGAGSSRPILYSRGTCHDLGTLGGSFGNANDVNRERQVTGAANLAGDAVAHAFLYSDGVMRDLGSFGGASKGSAINSEGEVAGTADTSTGSREFLYRHHVMKDLGTLGGSYSTGNAINDKGHVVGTSRLPCSSAPCKPAEPVEHAFIYADGRMRDLDTLGSWDSVAYGINNSGQVVGFLTNNDEFEDFRAFVYTDGAMHVVNDFLDDSGAGWTLLWANAINDSGQIVAHGAIDRQFGQIHAVLLTPSRRKGHQ